MTAKIFNPDSPDELIRGWALHAAKARRKHEEAARRLDGRRYWLGVPAVILSAVVGASVIASLEAQFGVWVTILMGMGSVAASVLASLQTFLAYADRAEKHRAAGVEYKAAIRKLEEKMSETVPAGKIPPDGSELTAWLEEMRSHLDDLERKAPIVPHRIHAEVENVEFSDFKFVGSAEDLRRTPRPLESARPSYPSPCSFVLYGVTSWVCSARVWLACAAADSVNSPRLDIDHGPGGEPGSRERAAPLAPACRL